MKQLPPRLQELHDFLQGTRLDCEHELSYSFKASDRESTVRRMKFIGHEVVQELEAIVNED